ncbi:MAG: phosphoenolpyruvate carboxykinase (GTP) [Candidatus Omnitrophica bacterium]|nr:phosphoenolpyruvate carboxykinase (GTP) [Candidatus Omnitrophota bacterium]
MKSIEVIKSKCAPNDVSKLEALKNQAVLDFIAGYLELCNPDSAFVRTDSKEDALYIRKKAIELKEESELAVDGHTIHFDGYFDQARDKKNTKYLIPEGDNRLGSNISKIEREAGLSEINLLLKDIMKGKQVYICFFCLGPNNSEFSIPAVQITDSSYVAHSEDILYRSGYEEFMNLKGSDSFFKFVHSAGLLENGVSRDVEKRRVYIDLKDNIVYSTNTQYAGNTVGLKKLAMRLAINKSSREGWLTEHMFIMGIGGQGGRTTYFAGAFPSACGKTSTAMLEGETIVGDDIAYFRKVNGQIRAVNVERGMFGIIRDVNSKADPLIWNALNGPGEVIFSNILITGDKVPYWLGKDGEVPPEGLNYSGSWQKGKKDKDGAEITPSHKNARYTVRLGKLSNYDQKAEDAEGVEVKGVIYGGRDSDASVPVEQAFNWQHGILAKASTLESETTAATLGQEGVRKFNPMSNLDFLSIPIGEYISNNLSFVEGVKSPPVIFSVNYFLKAKDGGYLNGIHDKHVWLKWMELRVHNEVEAIKTPSGYIPLYEDLKRLFKDVLDKDYPEGEYNEQFKLRIPENLAKIERIIGIYKKQVSDAPAELFDELEAQKKRLLRVSEKFGENVVPEDLKGMEL